MHLRGSELEEEVMPPRWSELEEEVMHQRGQSLRRR